MERQRKERLVGAAVLIMLAVIFIPMILDNSVQPESGITGTNIPPQPEGEFTSRVIPLAAPGGGGREAGADAETGTAPARKSAAAPVTASDRPEGAVASPASSAPPVAQGTVPVAAAGVPASPMSASTKPTATDTPASARQAPPAAGVTAWVVQLGSFASAENAESLNKKLRQSGYSAFVEPLQQGGTKVFRVRVGPELRRSSAQSVRDRLQANMGLDGIVVPYP